MKTNTNKETYKHTKTKMNLINFLVSDFKCSNSLKKTFNKHFYTKKINARQDRKLRQVRQFRQLGQVRQVRHKTSGTGKTSKTRNTSRTSYTKRL
jgi:hypothetical protein